MLKKSIIIFCVLLSIFIYSPIFAQNSNLVLNGSFEDTFPSKYWTSSIWDTKATDVFSIDDSVFKSGKNSLKISNSIANDSRYTQSISIKPNKYYRVSCWAKTRSVVKDKTGANISIKDLTVMSNDLHEDHDDWEYLELIGKTGNNQTLLPITIGLGGYGSINTGTAWFDEITVSELAALPAGKNSVSFEKSTSKSDTTEKPSFFSKISYGPVFFIILVGVMILIYYFSVSNKSNSKSSLHKRRHRSQIVSEPIDTPLSLVKKDWIIMSSITLIYAAIAFFYLGSFNVPVTAWKPQSLDEQFSVSFQKPETLSKLSMYSGIANSWSLTSKLEVKYLSNENVMEHLVTLTKTDDDSIYKWNDMELPPVTTSKLSFTVLDAGTEILEIAIFSNDSSKPLKNLIVSNDNIISTSGSTTSLFDESDKYEKPSLPLYGMYFDEIYHARTALEFLRHYEPYENTHPPLGKLIISTGIFIFGMVPFGWRFAGVLAGVIMVPVMYIFGKRAFGSTYLAFATAFLMAVDFMHFAQTRIATIDSFVTLFIILMYYYMYQYFMEKSYLNINKSLRYLFLSGLFFGLGAATKWIALYGAVGLATLFLIAKLMEHKDYKKALLSKASPDWVLSYKKNTIKSLIVGIIGFIILPAIIYWMSYIPFMLVPGTTNGLSTPINNAKHMYEYHSTLKAEHGYQSTWWEWPLMIKPIAFVAEDGNTEGTQKRIFSFGNPAVWWIGILTFWLCLLISIKKGLKGNFVFIVAVVFQFAPWILIPRIAFIYHYFSIVPFMIFSIVFVIKELLLRRPKLKQAVNYYFVFSGLLFVAFYPIISGIDIYSKYIKLLKWLPKWYF